MTISKFIEKYSDDNEQFQRDFWLVIEKLGEKRFKSVATEVLSDIEGAELLLTTYKEMGAFAFGPKGKSLEEGIVVTYSRAYGESDFDWYHLLRVIGEYYITNSTK